MKTTRTYTMTARAQAVEETRRADPARPRFDAARASGSLAEIALDDVADRAGVSVQTVLRHFGSRAGLVEAAIDSPPSAGRARSGGRPSATSTGAVRVLVDHYEQRGDIVC